MDVISVANNLFGATAMNAASKIPNRTFMYYRRIMGTFE